MAKDKKVELKKLIMEFKVSMHCEGCQKSVAHALSKFKGVEKFTIDRNKHWVVVTGRIDPKKLLKKLKKTTKMTVEIASEKNEESCYECVMQQQFLPPNCCIKCEDLMMMFSDENPNACVIL
ncbi:heavy metal-associated isoprenylated plant protein 19-like [Lotus japonicus]|uniref:heavy metal-associated isoprenylated plant protein 19-like n=1 Tax=Lotus japonicus TaxID=34305 RepID=UPI002582AD3E|nr:heavy metal-associated isoprenylated plant protein 19-like [Lotus japonicus]